MSNFAKTSYEQRLLADLKEKIADEEISEDEAAEIYEEEMIDWGYGYGDYMYDLINDR